MLQMQRRCKTQGSLLWAFALTFGMVLAGGMTAGADDHDGRGTGTADRQWVDGPEDPPPMSEPLHEVDIQADVVIPVDDGTRLKAHVYLPDAPGEFPCLLVLEGYSKGSPSPSGLRYDFATRGYATASVEPRGIGSSEGEWHPYSPQFQQDAHDVLTWMAEQDWCDGNIGMFGTSYMAIHQYLAAKTLHPNLKAIIPLHGSWDNYEQLWYLGGMPPGSGRVIWPLFPSVQRLAPDGGDTDAWTTRVLSAHDSFYLEALEHPTFDEWWQDRSLTVDDLRAIADHDIAILFEGGWYDYFLKSESTGFRAFTEAGGKAKLVVGPWEHAGSGGVEPYSFQTYRILWFDRWLKGIDNGVYREDADGDPVTPRVLLHIPGADQWRFEDDWPIRDANNVPFYLHADGSGAAVSLNDGTLSAEPPRPGAPPAEYVYQPNNVASGCKCIGFAQQPDHDKRVNEVTSLTWTTPPFTSPTEITGPVHFRFWASTDAPDTDFVAEISRVAPNGSSEQMNAGWLKASHRKSHSNPTPLVPRQIYEFTVEVWPISQVFEPGERIRLTLSGADTPNRLPNTNPAAVTIYQDSDRPSHVVLPIIGQDGSEPFD